MKQMETNISFDKYQTVLNKSFFKKLGKVENVVGLTIESAGPDAKMGDMCKIYTDSEKKHGILAEVVGFKDKKTLLMPYEETEGIGLGCIVENMNYPLSVSVGESLLGKTLDGLGRCIDGYLPDPATVKRYPLEAAPPDPMSRTIISEVLSLGVKAVDGLITVGKGQRIGIFAGSGVGKSTLMGMFARNTKADINVIALIDNSRLNVLNAVGNHNVFDVRECVIIGHDRILNVIRICLINLFKSLLLFPNFIKDNPCDRQALVNRGDIRGVSLEITPADKGYRRAVLVDHIAQTLASEFTGIWVFFLRFCLLNNRTLHLRLGRALTRACKREVPSERTGRTQYVGQYRNDRAEKHGASDECRRLL